MEDQLISFKTAKLAKEKGFTELSYAWFYIYPKGTQNPKKHWKVADILEEDEIHELIGGQHGKTISEKYKNSEDQPHILARPTQSLLAKWLREVHNFHIVVKPNIYGDPSNPCIEYSYNGEKGERNSIFYPTYEEALEAGLQEVLNLIK